MLLEAHRVVPDRFSRPPVVSTVEPYRRVSSAVVFREMLPKMRVIREKPFPEMWVVDEMAGVEWKGGDKDRLNDNGSRLGHDHLGLGRRRWLERHHGDASLCRHPRKGP